MANRSFVCWKCRSVRRAEATYGDASVPRCPECRGPLEELGWRARVPAKDDLAGWDQLRQLHRDGRV